LRLFYNKLRVGCRQAGPQLVYEPAFALLMLLTAALPGCAVLASTQKCGVSGCRGDATITAEVRRRYLQHPSIGPPNLIDIQTIDHVVYLYGLVDTEEQQQLAEAVAREVNGVTKVVDAIGINNEGR
jgi:hypothetical protein